MDNAMPLYPVNLNINNRLCMVIGGGEVASRKIESLLVCGARIRVVSPAVCPRVGGLAAEGKVEWQQRGYQRGDLRGAFLVFATTDNSDIQRQVMSEAQELDILINSADNPEECSFQVPATVRQGDLLLAVSTGGGSPALAALIRENLAREYGPEYGLLVGFLSSIRDVIVNDGDTPWSHKAFFEKLLELDILSCLRAKDWPTLQEKLAGILPGKVNVAELVTSLASIGNLQQKMEREGAAR
jgi:precorrin-2 dehydrogenase / sirohydrochlorin ferrochelatase